MLVVAAPAFGQTPRTAPQSSAPADANITIVVREISSLAGGLREYANSKNITTMGTDGGKQVSPKFNYKEVATGKN